MGVFFFRIRFDFPDGSGSLEAFGWSESGGASFERFVERFFGRWRRHVVSHVSLRGVRFVMNGFRDPDRKHRFHVSFRLIAFGRTVLLESEGFGFPFQRFRMEPNPLVHEGYRSASRADRNRFQRLRVRKRVEPEIPRFVGVGFSGDGRIPCPVFAERMNLKRLLRMNGGRRLKDRNLLNRRLSAERRASRRRSGRYRRHLKREFHVNRSGV